MLDEHDVDTIPRNPIHSPAPRMRLAGPPPCRRYSQWAIPLTARMLLTTLLTLLALLQTPLSPHILSAVASSVLLELCAHGWRLLSSHSDGVRLCCPDSDSARLVGPMYGGEIAALGATPEDSVLIHSAAYWTCVLGGACRETAHEACADATSCCPSGYTCEAAVQTGSTEADTTTVERSCTWQSYTQERSVFTTEQLAAPLVPRDVSAQCRAEHSPCLHESVCAESYEGALCTCRSPAFVGPTCSFRCPRGQLCATHPSTHSSEYEWSWCPAGSFCPQSSLIPTPSPQRCPSGFFCPIGSAEPTPCPPGHLCLLAERSSSEPCAAGRFCPNATVSEECPTRSFCPSGSAQSTPCEIGFYCPTPGLAAGIPCPSGQRCATPGLLQPHIPQFVCPPGLRMASAEWGHTQSPSCCNPGTLYHTVTQACHTGRCSTSNWHFCNIGTVSCCFTGQTCVSNGCQSGSTVLIRMPWTATAQSAPVPAHDIMVGCLPGNSPCLHNSTCKPAFEGATCECTGGAAFSGVNCSFSCPAGMRCIDAPPLDSTVYTSEPCPAGFYCPAAAPVPTLPLPCPLGAFCPNATATPQLCSLGHMCNSTELAAPLPCDAGLACSRLNLTEPEGLCPQYHYCESGKPPQLCPPGTLCLEQGRSAPGSCPANHTCPLAGTREALAFSRFRCADDSAELMPLVSNDWPRCCSGEGRTRTGSGNSTCCIGPRCPQVFPQEPTLAGTLRLCPLTPNWGVPADTYCCPQGWSCGPSPIYQARTICFRSPYASYWPDPYDKQAQWQRSELPQARDISRNCEHKPCLHGGVCTPTFGGYHCGCPPQQFAQPNCTFLCPPGLLCSAAPPLNSTMLFDRTPCPAAHFCPGGTPPPTQPRNCTVGHYCPIGSGSPQPCPPRTLCNATLLSAPQSCPATSYCPRNATLAPTPCPAGSYCPLNSSAPMQCPAGQICKARSAAPSASSESLCRPGWHCAAGSSAPSACEAGFRCTGGSAPPLPCDMPGFYCPPESAEERACPKDFACPGTAGRFDWPSGAFSTMIYTRAEPCPPDSESREAEIDCRSITKCGTLQNRARDPEVDELRSEIECVWSTAAICLFVGVAFVTLAAISLAVVFGIRRCKRIAQQRGGAQRPIQVQPASPARPMKQAEVQPGAEAMGLHAGANRPAAASLELQQLPNSAVPTGSAAASSPPTALSSSPPTAAAAAASLAPTIVPAADFTTANNTFYPSAPYAAEPQPGPVSVPHQPAVHSYGYAPSGYSYAPAAAAQSYVYAPAAGPFFYPPQAFQPALQYGHPGQPAASAVYVQGSQQAVFCQQPAPVPMQLYSPAPPNAPPGGSALGEPELHVAPPAYEP